MLDLIRAFNPWLETAAILATFWALCSLGTRSWRFWHLAIGRDGRYSTSLFQGLAWTIVVLSSYLAIWFARVHVGVTGALGPVPQDVLAAMGLSLGTTAAAAGITSHRVRTRRDTRTRADRTALSQLLNDDLGHPSLSKAQLMAWTAVALLVYLVSTVDAVDRTMAATTATQLPPLPDIETTLLLLMGIGQGAYLALKAVSTPDATAEPTSPAAPPSSADPLAPLAALAALARPALPSLIPQLLAAAEPAAGPDVDAAAAAATANPGAVRVPGFQPSVNGLPFINAWPHEPDLTIGLPGVGTLPIGDASNGVCGGMVYTARDVFQTPGMAPIATADNPPPESPLFRYIVTRLLESFDVGHLGFARYYEWMLTPDADSSLGPVLVRRGLAWKTIVEEWAGRIRPELDAGRLVCLGLVTVAGSDPRLLGQNHQVMAYGYDLGADGALSLRIYDPNTPRAQADDVRISLSVLQPRQATPITHNVAIDHPIRGFFHTPYTYHDPSGQLG
ncbi:MAG TPA: hypothetical protein VIR16_04805 [Candidatus Limnocylindrales bacterium]